MLRTELKRAFCSKKFLGTILLALGIFLFSSFLYVQNYMFFDFTAPDLQSIEAQESAKKMVLTSLNKYDIWLAGFDWYMIMMPMICALPFSLSYIDDIENKMINNFNTRINHKKYIFNKAIVNALVGGTAVAMPVLIALILINLCFGGTVEDFSTRELFGGMYNSLFLNKYYIYILIHIVIEFLFGFSYSNISLAVSTKIKSSMVVLLSPFIFWAGTSIVLSFTGLPIRTPMDISQFYMCNDLSITTILIQLSFVFIVSLIVYVLNSKKESIYEKRNIVE